MYMKYNFFNSEMMIFSVNLDQLDLTYQTDNSSYELD
jgi:hypothetical protein